jgi:hypothetical protein
MMSHSFAPNHVAVHSIVFALALCILSPQRAFAQETTLPVSTSASYSIESLGAPDDVIPGDFVVGPGKTELTISPGTTKTVELLITNRTGVARTFSFEIEDATGSTNPNQSVVLLGDDRGPYTLKDYITLPQMSFDLKHNERARVPVTISVPYDAEPGGRYGSVLVTTVTKDAIKGDTNGTAPASAIISRVGSLFFLTVPGDTYTEGALQSFKTIPDKHLFTQGPLNFQLLFENKGDLHLNPYGEIRITNLLGEEVGFVELDPWFALPKSLRSREVEWNRELLIGRYTATAHINRGYDDIVDTQQVTFWVLPVKLVAVVLGSLFILFLLIGFVIRNFEFKRKQV